MALLFLLLAQMEPTRTPLRQEVETGRQPADTVPQDSIYTDTLDEGVSTVLFAADTIIYYSRTRNVLLLGNGKVEYGDLEVYSDSIKFSTEKKLLSAYKNARFMERGGDSLVGEQMHYAVETQKGVMQEGRTQIEEGYFYGKGVWLVEDEVLHITRGYYTTCELDPPHYDFYGRQLKVLLNDMVISRPILLRVGKVPVLAAPFWYLPIGPDRQSGLMPFKFGHSDAEGWFAKQIRYYWVINPYSDALFNLDVMTEKGFRPGVYLRWLYGPRGAEYARGSFNANYITEIDTRERRWEVGLNNTSNFTDGTRLTADVNFRSDQSYLLEYIEDEDSLTRFLDQETRSAVSVSRDILGRPTSLSASRVDDLQTGEYTMTLPTFNFSWPTVDVLDFFTINFSSFRVANQYAHELPADTGEVFLDSRTTTFSQPLSFSWSYKFFRAYTFSQSYGAGQSLTYSEERLSDSLIQDTLIRGGTYSLTNSISTEFYRIFGLYFLGMNGVLHSVRPSITHSLTPATDVLHPWVAYPRFDTTLASHSINFSLGQNLQTKIRRRADTTRFRKQDLLNLSAGIGYNLLTDSLSPVTAGINLPSGLPVYVNARASYHVYTEDFSLSTSVSASIDEIIFPLLGLRKRREITSDTADTLGVEQELPDTIPPDTLPPDSVTAEEEEEEEETFAERFSRSKLFLDNTWDAGTDTLGGFGKTSHMLSARTQLFLPWNTELNLSVAFNLNQPQDTFTNYFASYNLSLVKGLHCWEAVFEVAPRDGTGLGWDNLEWNIYMRIKELPDIEIGRGLLREFGISP